MAQWTPVVVLTVALYFIVVSCSQSPSTEPVAAGPETTTTENPAVLSEWGQLEVTEGQLLLAQDVAPYRLNSALFSDYAHKLRTVWLPEGSEPAQYDAEDVFNFPVGTIITKTFYYPTDKQDVGDALKVLKAPALSDTPLAPLDLSTVQLIETRVLHHRETGWVALPYVWNAEQTEATLERTGDLVSLTLVDGAMETPFIYVVPDTNQCSGCHATNHTTGAIQPIGPKARHLNTQVNLGDGTTPQLEAWQAIGLLEETTISPTDMPRTVVWDDDSVSLNDRARAYLDINCSHCHNRDGAADTSALYLEPSTEIGPSLGVCKPPVAAGSGTGGRLVGITPGDPDNSIFVYRMTTLDPGEMMPEVGRSIPHAEGVDLISAWIESLAGSC